MRVFSYNILYVLIFFLSYNLGSSAAQIIGNETDRLALHAFKSQIRGDPFQVMSSWNDSSHFCDWEGVACDRRIQRVTILDLSNKGLFGSLSPHIGNLSFLRELILQNNTFYGDIFKEFGKLSRLQVLALNNNYLEGTIPLNISQCFNLKQLIMGFNNLHGIIPMELGSLSKLVNISLPKNKLIGGIPPSFGNLTYLETLSLGSNSFTGSIPCSLKNLKRLKRLELDDNMLSGLFPPVLYNFSTFEIISTLHNQLRGNVPTGICTMLPNLQRLSISGNQFSGVIPTSLCNCSKLQIVDISFIQFVGEVPSNMGNLKELTQLSMSANHLGSGKSGDLDFITSLTNCSNLQIFSIGANEFGGMLPASVANFSDKLTQLYLYENQITGTFPSEIENFQNLISLSFGTNFFIGSIPVAIGKLPNLQTLNLSGNYFSGHIPFPIKNMCHLYVLDLSNNNLDGSMASALGNAKLQTLYLSGNRFSGVILKEEISQISFLSELDLSKNSLSGTVPLEVCNLRYLMSLDLSENKLSGQFSSDIAGFFNLQYLNLRNNFFSGPLNPSVSLSPRLVYLDVSHNSISGKIPRELGKMSALQYLNLSSNDFEGEVPIDGIFQNASAVFVSGNDKICGGILSLGLPKCSHQKSEKQGSGLALKVTIGAFIPAVILVMLVVIYLKRKSRVQQPPQKSSAGIRRISYNDIYKATDGFSLANLIGTGSYGSVFKVMLRQYEGLVAVKVLKLMKRGASKGFVAECGALSAVRHRNILKLLTVCSSVDFSGNDFKALVFKYMPNGALGSWLHPTSDDQHTQKSLSLYQRLSIAIDVASALDYLHNHYGTPIIHRDLKPSNVLLDNNLTAHVGDFGLAKFLYETEDPANSNKYETASIAVYIPPEYGMGAEASTQGDVYSYGILLLEMFTRKSPTDHMFQDGLSLHDYCRIALHDRAMDIIDKRLLLAEAQNEVSKSSFPSQ